jgi:alkaline phosphatase D
MNYFKPVFYLYLLFTLTANTSIFSQSSQQPLTRIAFGSCSRENKEQPMWQYILDNQPQLWIWLGDNIYGDTDDMALLKQKYERQKSHVGYRKLLTSTPIIGIWDDHDYGRNDAGKEYAYKKESQQLMLDFLDVPSNSHRRKREGAYEAYTYGPRDKQVKIILLDARYFRDSLQKQGKAYMPNVNGDILGDAQWKWLEKELTSSSASFHIIGSGIQMIPEQHMYEKWANFPKARKRLFELLASTKAKGVILLSGDRHIAEISKYENASIGYPIYEVTASGLTHSATTNQGEPNKYRVKHLVNELNFGMISIDWNKNPVEVHLQVRGLNNGLFLDEKVKY